MRKLTLFPSILLAGYVSSDAFGRDAYSDKKSDTIHLCSGRIALSDAQAITRISWTACLLLTLVILINKAAVNMTAASMNQPEQSFLTRKIIPRLLLIQKVLLHAECEQTYGASCVQYLPRREREKKGLLKIVRSRNEYTYNMHCCPSTSTCFR